MIIETRDDAERYGRREVADIPPQGWDDMIGTTVVVPPCVPQPWPDKRAKGDRVCPRVELDADNVVPMALVQVLLDARTHPSFQPLFDATCGWKPADERASILSRVNYAAGSEPVRDAIKRIGETREREHAARAKAARRG